MFAVHLFSALHVAPGSQSLILCLVRVMRRAALFGTLAALALAACQSAPPRGSTSKPAEFIGTIVYDPTGRPLANVKVQLLRVNKRFFGFPGAPDVLATTKTDTRGRFRMVTTYSGPYEIDCFRPGRHFGSGARDVRPFQPIFIRYQADPKPHP